MKKRTYVRVVSVMIESACDQGMILWLGQAKIEASCSMVSARGGTRLSGTVRGGPAKYLNRTIEITTTDNENGQLIWLAA